MDEDQDKVAPIRATVGATGGAHGRLAYAIELWDAAGAGPERVLGRAASVIVGRAIFQAAQAEHPDRRVVLRRGRDVIARSD